MQLIAAFLKSHPEAAIFLAMAIGVVIGRFKIGGFSLGNATAVPAGAAHRQPGLTIARGAAGHGCWLSADGSLISFGM